MRGPDEVSPDGRWLVVWEKQRESASYFESSETWEVTLRNATTGRSLTSWVRTGLSTENGHDRGGVASVRFEGEVAIARFEDGPEERVRLPPLDDDERVARSRLPGVLSADGRWRVVWTLDRWPRGEWKGRKLRSWSIRVTRAWGGPAFRKLERRELVRGVFFRSRAAAGVRRVRVIDEGRTLLVEREGGEAERIALPT